MNVALLPQRQQRRGAATTSPVTGATCLCEEKEVSVEVQTAEHRKVDAGEKCRSSMCAHTSAHCLLIMQKRFTVLYILIEAWLHRSVNVH